MATPDVSAARELLTSTKLLDLFKPQHVVSIKAHASVDQCLRVRCRFLVAGVGLRWHMQAMELTPLRLN